MKWINQRLILMVSKIKKTLYINKFNMEKFVESSNKLKQTKLLLDFETVVNMVDAYGIVNFFFNEKFCILIQILVKIVPRDLIINNNWSALEQIMAGCRILNCMIQCWLLLMMHIEHTKLQLVIHNQTAL